MTFRTMAEVRAANAAIGHQFFDAGSLRFFDSRIGRTLYGGRYFITSEQFHGSDGYTAPRMYTVREVMPDGKIETVADFQKFDTNEQARAAIRRLLKGGEA